MSVWYKRLQYALFGVNILYFAMGAAVLGFGTWLLTDKTVNKYAFTDEMKETLVGFSVLIMATGIYMMLTCIFGLFGAYCRNQCLLVFVFFLLCPLSAGFYYFGVDLLSNYMKVDKTMVDDIVTDLFEFGVRNYFDGNDNFVREAMDMLQKDLKCCGATTGLTDYPPSRRDEVACYHPNAPCVDKLQDFLYTSIESSIICMLVIASVALLDQILLVAFCYIKRQQNRQVTTTE